jgi:hypothetical protein
MQLRPFGRVIAPMSVFVLSVLALTAGPSLPALARQVPGAAAVQITTPGWNWLRTGSGDVGSFTAYSSNNVPEGHNYLEFNTSEPDGSVYQDVEVDLQPNQSYTFSAWVRADAAKPEQVCLALFGLGSDTQNGRTCRSVGRAWTLISAPYDVGPSGETTLRSQVYLGTTGVNCDLAGASLAAQRPTSPYAPGSVSAKAGKTDVTVKWKAPSWSGGSPLIAYLVTVSPGGSTIRVAASARSAIVRKLKKHTSYRFTVKAVNGAGTSNPTASSQIHY